MSERDVSAGEPADEGHAESAGREASDEGSVDARRLGSAPRAGAAPRAGWGVRGGVLVVATWLLFRGGSWLWPWFVAPSTDEVCGHLLALSAAPDTHPVAHGEVEITHDGCVSKVERRLQRRGVIAAAALRHCLGTADSLADAATCG